MCIDPKGVRLERYALCICGASFPECDFEEARTHINHKEGVRNHRWTYVHKDWINIIGCSDQVRP